MTSPGSDDDIAPGAAGDPDVPSAEELRRAMKAFKKRLKLARLDDESRLGRSAMSPGGKSSIVSSQPPSQYSRAVWDELVRRGRLKYVGQGLYEIAAPPDTH